MGDRTGIEWTDATWNPVRGCSRVSAGCENCYAEKVAARFHRPGLAYEGLTRETAKGRVWNGEIMLLPEQLDQPLRWRKPRRIFVNSMSDLFHEGVPESFIRDVFGVMSRAKQHTFQILTKRPERMRRTAKALGFNLPNVWLGVSVEDQAAADERIPLLLQTPAAVRFLSVEPLLGPVDLLYPKTVWPDGPQRCCSGFECGCMGKPVDPPLIWGNGGWIDWIIVGGESGPGARPCDVKWIASIVQDCRDAGVPCFVKQLGAKAIDDRLLNVGVKPARPYRLPLKSRKGDDPSEWPEALRVQEFPGGSKP